MKFRDSILLSAVASGAALLAGCSDTDDFPTGSPQGPGAGATPLDFELPTRVTFGSPGLVQSLLADLDGDGLEDLVEADLFGHQVRVGAADGGTNFLPAQTIDLFEAPVSVAAGDLDGDGAAELAILTVFIGDAEGMTLGALSDGVGSFAASDVTLRVYDRPQGGGELFELTSVHPGGAAFELTTIDLGLGTDVLVLPLPGLGTLELWRLEGLELIAQDVLTSKGPTGESGPFTALALDLTGDGLLDLLVGEADLDGGTPGSIALFEQQLVEGAPTFAEAVRPAALQNAPSVPLLVRLPDLDADGVDDVAALDVGPGADALALIGSNAGDPTPLAAYTVGGPSTGAAVGDFDGDGVRELVVAAFDGRELLTLPLPGFAGEAELPAPLEIGLFPRGLRVVDLGNDGIDDLAMHHSTGTTFLFGGDAGLRGTPGYEVPLNTQFVRSADLDQDGFGDAITLDLDQRRLTFLRGLSDGSLEPVGFVALEPAPEQVPGSFCLGDFDADGDVDVAVAVYGADVLRVYENDGVLPFGPTALEFPVQGGPLGVATADMDGDGLLDLVVGQATARSVRILRGDGELGFETVSNNSTGARPLAIAVGDLDDDGDVDVVFTADGTDSGLAPALLVLENQAAPDGTPSLTVRSNLALPRISTEVVVADLDGDAALEVVANQPGLASTDLIVADAPSGAVDDYAVAAVEVLLEGQFDVDPAAFAVADVDGDGLRDLLVVAATGRPVFLANAGNLEFVVSALPGSGNASPAAPYGVRSAGLAFVDGDDIPDLLLVTPDLPRLWVALGSEVAGLGAEESGDQ